MIILDNIIFDLRKVGGVSKYWAETIKRLDKTNLSITFLEGSSISNNFDRNKLSLKGEKILDKGSAIKRRLISPRIEAEIFHSSYYRVSTKAKFNIVTIHDFINEKYPSHPRDLILSKIKKHACSVADHIVVVSECTKKDLLEHYPSIDPNTVSVIYNGVDDSFFPDNCKAVIKTPRGVIEPNKYFLYVGGRGKCKNFNYVLSIFSKAQRKKKGNKLVIVGENSLSNKEYAVAKELGIDLNDIIQIGYADHTLLRQLYSNSLGLLIPSLYEGFGLPALEAARCGSIVIGASGSALDEVVGDSNYMIDLTKENEIERILDLVFDDESQEVEAKRLLERSSKFCWNNSVSKLENLYKDLLKKV